MLLIRPTYYQDVSKHRQDIATLLLGLDAENRRKADLRAIEHVTSDRGERNDADTIGVIGVHSSSLVTSEQQIVASAKHKPWSVVGFVDL